MAVQTAATSRDARTDVLSVRDLRVYYHTPRGAVRAVDGVTFDIKAGERLGLVGESGSGKTTIALALMQLIRAPGKIEGGEVLIDGENLIGLTDEQMRQHRLAVIAMVAQGAMNSLNPVISIRDQLEDVFTTHRPEMGKRERRDRCGDLLERVGVDRARLHSYPHELSGGMRQRVMIAMAMALEPQIMIMDEPTTALDVVVQREILREISRLRDELGFAVLFITHDLPLLLEISDRIAVMKDGEVVELAGAAELYTNPGHEYTRKLLASFPRLTGAPR
jgi:peptide/nickel transport system ATP-binding protein